MLYGVTLPTSHPPSLSTQHFLPLLFFCLFIFPPLVSGMLCQGLQMAPSLLILFSLPTCLPPSLRHSVSLSVLWVCYFPPPTSHPFSLFLYNFCSILVFYPLTSILLLLLIISAILIWFDNVPDLLTGIWLPWAWLVGNVLFNDKVYCITEIKMHFFISRKLPATRPLSVKKIENVP